MDTPIQSTQLPANLTDLLIKLRAAPVQTPTQALTYLKSLIGYQIRIKCEITGKSSKTGDGAIAGASNTKDALDGASNTKDAIAGDNTLATAGTHAGTNGNAKDGANGGAKDRPTNKSKKNTNLPKDKVESFTYLEGCNISRIILTSRDNVADFSRELVRQCNGVVLEYPTWKVLAVPPRCIAIRFKLTEVMKNLSDYDIIEISDGTMLTLYWYEPAIAVPTTVVTSDIPMVSTTVTNSDIPVVTTAGWCISSKNGFDVGTYQWIGPVTYMNAFMELAATYPQFNLDNLCKNCSYSINMRYADFHPLTTDAPKLYLIQVVNNQTLQVLTRPVQSTLTLGTDSESNLPKQYQPDIGLPVQAIINVSRKDSRVVAEAMLTKNRNALLAYITSTDNLDNRTALRSLANISIHYGYVLRSNTGAADVVLESLLLKKIRLLIYNLPKPNHINAVSITPQNRLEYCILRAYLSYTMKYDLINLFPQYERYYTKYNGIFDTLTFKILTLLRCNEKVIAKSRKQSYADKVPLHCDLISRIDKLAVHLARHIELNSKVNVLDASGPSIVSNFIFDQCHLDMYYVCLIAPIV